MNKSLHIINITFPGAKNRPFIYSISIRYCEGGEYWNWFCSKQTLDCGNWMLWKYALIDKHQKRVISYPPNCFTKQFLCNVYSNKVSVTSWQAICDTEFIAILDKDCDKLQQPDVLSGVLFEVIHHWTAEKCLETLRALIETNSDHLQSNQDINPMLQWWSWFRYLGWYSTSKWPETISQSVSFLPPVDLLFWLQDASSDIESWLWLMSSNTNTSEDAPI